MELLDHRTWRPAMPRRAHRASLAGCRSGVFGDDALLGHERATLARLLSPLALVTTICM